KPAPSNPGQCQTQKTRLSAGFSSSRLQALSGSSRSSWAALSFDTTNSLDRQTQTTFLVSFNDLDLNNLTYFQHVIDVGDTVVGNLGDMQQAVTAWQHLHNRAKVQQTHHWAFVFLTHFHFSGQFFNTTLGFAGLVQIGAGDRDGAIIRNIDLCTGFFGQGADGCTTLTNHVTNLLGVD